MADVAVVIEALLKSDQYQASLKKAVAENKKATDQIAKDQTNLVSKVSGAWKAVMGSAAVVGAIAALKKAFDFAKEFDAFQDAMRQFEAQTGQSARKAIGYLKELTGGAISQKDAIIAANRAMTTGVTQSMEEIGQLWLVAKARADAIGGDSTAAFNQLTDAISKGAPKALKDLGIVTEGWDAMAKAQGVVVDRQFILSQVLAQGGDIVAKAGGAAALAGDRYDRLAANLDDLKVNVGGFADAAFAPFIDGLNSLLSGETNLEATTASLITTSKEYSAVLKQLEDPTAKLTQNERELLEVRRATLELDIAKKIEELNKRYKDLTKTGFFFRGEQQAILETIARLTPEQQKQKALIEKLRQEYGTLAKVTSIADDGLGGLLVNGKKLDGTWTGLNATFFNGETLLQQYNYTTRRLTENKAKLTENSAELDGAIRNLADGYAKGSINAETLGGLTDELRDRVMALVPEMKRLNEEQSKAGGKTPATGPRLTLVDNSKESKKAADELEKIATDAINEIADKNHDAYEKRKQEAQELKELEIKGWQAVASAASDAIGTIAGAVSESADRRIDDLERQQAAELEGLDSRRQLREIEKDEEDQALEEALQRLTEAREQGDENAIADAEREYNKLELTRQNREEEAKINEKFRKQVAAEKRKAAVAEKGAAIFQALINGALAITGIWAQFGAYPPVAAALTAVAATANLIQVGLISSKPVPQFAKGGRPRPGMPAIVGEEGPELFVPDGSGTIIPNPALRDISFPSASGAGSDNRSFSESTDNRNFYITIPGITNPVAFANALERDYGLSVFKR